MQEVSRCRLNPCKDDNEGVVLVGEYFGGGFWHIRRMLPLGREERARPRGIARRAPTVGAMAPAFGAERLGTKRASARSSGDVKASPGYLPQLTSITYLIAELAAKGSARDKTAWRPRAIGSSPM